MSRSRIVAARLAPVRRPAPFPRDLVGYRWWIRRSPIPALCMGVGIPVERRAGPEFRSRPDGRFFSDACFGPAPRWSHMFRDAEGYLPDFPC